MISKEQISEINKRIDHYLISLILLIKKRILIYLERNASK